MGKLGDLRRTHAGAITPKLHTNADHQTLEMTMASRLSYRKRRPFNANAQGTKIKALFKTVVTEGPKRLDIHHKSGHQASGQSFSSFSHPTV